MKTIAIKMKNYAMGVDMANDDNPKRRVLNIMLLFLGALVFCYVFFLGNMIFNIIERSTLEADARSLLNEVGGLESQYLSISNKVDLNLAQSMGFREIKDKQYAVRKTLGSIKLAKNEL